MVLLFDPMPIVWAVVVFAVVISLLASMLIAARKKLVPQGDIKIIVNGDTENPIYTQAGGMLLGALSDKDIFLPSACGGGGTCAMCTCQVNSGGGDILPTELNHITRKDAADNWRLSCQVKVREDMEIHIPEEIFGIKKWECEVVSNDNVATFIKEFVVKLPKGETLDFESGGYIQIDVPVCEIDFKDIDVQEEYREDWDSSDMWNLKMKNPEPQFRAYSMANHPAEGDIVMLNIRIATPPPQWDFYTDDQGKKRRKFAGYMPVNPGICSSYVFGSKPGDKVTISGPYGEFFIKPTGKEMVYIGGGAGMAPLRSHLLHLFHTDKTRNRKVSYWYGGRSVRELFYTDDFRTIEKEYDNFSYHIALSDPLPEDNWKVKDSVDGEGDGYLGFVHQVLYDNYLQHHPEPEEIEYYFCGPPLMNAAVIKMLDDLGVPEENIAFDDFGG